MKRPFALALLLLWAAPLWADPPKFNVPAEVKAQPNSWVVISPETDAKSVVYIGLDGLSAFPSSELKDPRKMVLFVPASGSFRFVGVASLNDEQVAQNFKVTVEGTPTPPPGPGPAPGPTPGPGPDPFGSRSATPGLRCLIVYESADEAKYPPAQLAVLTSTVLRQYLNSHCVTGPDGNKDWRAWDQNVDASRADPMWQKVLARPRTKLPWIVIGNGTAGYEGPLPADLNSTLDLLKKYGGN